MDYTTIITEARKKCPGLLTHFNNGGQRKLIFKNEELRDTAEGYLSRRFPEATFTPDEGLGVYSIEVIINK
jgi:hypothetical protein